MRSNARCGHTEYDKGHCAEPGCPNDFRACQDCQPKTVHAQAREAARDMWRAAFGSDPS